MVALGLRDFVVPGWNGLMAPKGTPPAVVAKLSDALSNALNTEASVRAFNAMGFKPGSGTPEAMRRQIEHDMRLFTTVIRERKLKFDSWPVGTMQWNPFTVVARDSTARCAPGVDQRLHPKMPQ